MPKYFWDRSFTWFLNQFSAKFLETLTTEHLEIGKSPQKQSVSIFRRLLAICFSLVIGGGYEARRFGERGMGRDMGAARARRKTDCSLSSCF